MKKPTFALLFLLACSSSIPRGVPSTSSQSERPSTASALSRAIEAERGRLLAGHNATRVDIIALDIGSREVLAGTHHGSAGAVGIGSTLKPFTVAAALQAGLDLGQRFDGEEGRWETAEGIIEDHRAEESLDAELVLVRSSNVGAAKIAQTVGVDRVASFLRDVDLAVNDERWRSEGLFLSTGIGVEATPLDVAKAYATLASGVNADGRRVLDESTTTTVRAMLEHAVSEGTGHAAAVSALRVAGKTGSVRLDDGHGAWFAGMVPAEDPKMVVVVYAEVDEGWGGSVAAPSFARIVSAWNAER